MITVASSESGFAELFRKRFDEYVEQLSNGLQRDFDNGTEESAIPAYQAATQLLAVYEGLQIQMLVRPHIDVMVEFDRSVRTLRQGWKQHELPSWDLDADVPERETPQRQRSAEHQQAAREPEREPQSRP
ncbi:hypothetical protein [Curtobacterium sp. 24E2]|nr:hypothetical protein JN350_16855 [Curtobacterium sp. 24E2]